MFDNEDAWELISKEWNSKTQETYLKEYVNLIMPYVNEKPLIEYTKKDFESALARIRTIQWAFVLLVFGPSVLVPVLLTVV